jgi:hypothetical protein
VLAAALALSIKTVQFVSVPTPEIEIGHCRFPLIILNSRDITYFWYFPSKLTVAIGTPSPLRFLRFHIAINATILLFRTCLLISVSVRFSPNLDTPLYNLGSCRIRFYAKLCPLLSNVPLNFGHVCSKFQAFYHSAIEWIIFLLTLILYPLWGHGKWRFCLFPARIDFIWLIEERKGQEIWIRSVLRTGNSNELFNYKKTTRTEVILQTVFCKNNVNSFKLILQRTLTLKCNWSVLSVWHFLLFDLHENLHYMLFSPFKLYDQRLILDQISSTHEPL